MPIKSKKEDHIETAKVLESWAEKYRVTENPYVTQLISALRNRKNLTFWATLSPFEFLPKPLATNLQKRRVISFAGLLRNTLIFTPVALTWTAIGKATTAYQIYNEQNPNNLSNFLDFWQNGYGLLSESWTIGKIAITDALIIGFVILLIIGIQFYTQKVIVEESKLQSQIDSERFQTSQIIGEYLFSKREISEIKLKDELANAKNDLTKSTSNLNKITKDLERFNKTNTYNKLISELKKYNKKTSNNKSSIDPFNFAD